MSRVISQADVQALCAQARAVPRLRAHRNFHASYDEPIQRLLMAMQPGSYVRPHRHAEDDRWEFMVVLAGSAGLLEFDDTGTVIVRQEMRPGGAQVGVEICAHTWHTLFALEADTVLLEFKAGPYRALSDKDFASWAPAEGEAGCGQMCAWYTTAQVGQRFGGK